MLSTEQLPETRTGIDTDDTMGENLWFIDAQYEGSQKDLSFPSTPLGKAPARKASVNNLRIDTYPKSDLPERYNSDEEEQSASPDSETASIDDDEDEDGEEVEEEQELKHKSDLKIAEEDNDFVIYEDSSAQVAVAVPLMMMGPPKLIDITNHAPIQKRKRTINHPTLQRSAMKNAVTLASRSPALSDISRHSALPAPSRSAPLIPFNESAPQSKVSTPTTTEHLPKRQDSLPDLARSVPDSWLPEESSDALLESVDEQDDLYFPALDVRSPPTYNDYDPYSLNPPSLSPIRNSTSFRNSPRSPAFPSPLLKKQPGSIARARKLSNPPPSAMSNNNGGWKGLTRTLSMAKRQEAIHPQAKKPKMIARGPTEREEMPSIPPFPSEEKLGGGGSRAILNACAGSATALSLKS